MPRKSLHLKNAFAALQEFALRHKRPPSYEETRQLFRYRSKNAAYWLIQKLIQAGFLSRDHKGKLVFDARGGVRLLGTVQAGFPSPAEEELVDVLRLEEYLIKNPQSTYLIRVTGDSMIEAGIHQGDLVLVERGRQPQHKDIVIAQVDGEWTMKYYTKTKREIILLPANPKYRPIKPKQELLIGGVVISVIRKYK